MKGNMSSYIYSENKRRMKSSTCFLRGKNVYGWHKIYRSRFQLNKITYQVIGAVQT